ncbi:MAG: RNA degradosome polyphosphate kinase, partial [Methanimicrococcus sp.]|nr:RNA degradosome polyphosphate kinase [Methanimicrococcus sp.]
MSQDSIPPNDDKFLYDTAKSVYSGDKHPYDPKYYIDRDSSWLQFNYRVLDEALDPKNPLLERVRFLSIFANNLDEYYMVRIPAVHKWALESGISPDGNNQAYESMQEIYKELFNSLNKMEYCWSDVLIPELEKQNIHILKYFDLENYQTKYLTQYFEKNILPLLTPLAYDSSHPFPYITNQSVNLAVILSDPVYGRIFVRVKIPPGIKRLIPVPFKEDIKKADKSDDVIRIKSGVYNFVWAEDVIIANLDLVFPGQIINEAHAFRITRDGDIGLDEDGDFSLLKSVEKKAGVNYFGAPLRIEINSEMSDYVLQILTENLKLRSS